ncbi:MAG: hypothetical protein MUC35_06270 [Candidatus Margulisbacteria bacterium]|jgi:hypothetical protein|nr:hypothetical protein [Candidatus Margulisiibacteriota bacterium]
MAPSLSQVLTVGNSAASSSVVNPLLLAAGLLLSLVAAVSVAKGVEVFRRRGALAKLAGPQPCLEDTHYQEKMAKLSFMLDEMKLEKESVVEQNHELRNQLTSLSSALYDLKQLNEKLVPAPEPVSEPVVSVPVVEAVRPKTRTGLKKMPKTKTPVRTKAKAAVTLRTKSKEDAGRKPRRVSRSKK